MPDRRRHIAGRDVAEGNVTVRVSLARKGRVDHTQITAHVVVDFAADRDCPTHGEILAARLVAPVQLDLETGRLREAVDRVAHPVEIGEGDRASLRDDQRAGDECLVALGYCHSPGETDRTGMGAIAGQFDHGIAHRHSALIDDLDLDVVGCRRPRQRCGQGGKDREKAENTFHYLGLVEGDPLRKRHRRIYAIVTTA